MSRCAAKPWGLPRLLSLSMACTLVGCESAEQFQKANAQHCARYGFQPDTVAFARCLHRESLALQGLVPRYQLEQTAGAWWGAPYAAHWWY